MLGTETRYWRAIGTAQSLIEKAAALGQSWLKGLGSAQLLMRRQAACFSLQTAPISLRFDPARQSSAEYVGWLFIDAG